MMTPRLREKMGKAAVRAAQVVGYSNVGTVEFLLSADGNFYFIEMNTRIQVEHGVTEMVTGIDLVQREPGARDGRAAAAQTAPGHDQRRGDGVSDLCRGSRHAPAVARRGVESSCARGTRSAGEIALYDGYRVPVQYDPLIAKLIVHAGDRAGVVTRARAALREYLVDGIKTNIPLHLRILRTPIFCAASSPPIF